MPAQARGFDAKRPCSRMGVDCLDFRQSAQTQSTRTRSKEKGWSSHRAGDNWGCGQVSPFVLISSWQRKHAHWYELSWPSSELYIKGVSFHRRQEDNCRIVNDDLATGVSAIAVQSFLTSKEKALSLSPFKGYSAINYSRVPHRTRAYWAGRLISADLSQRF